jgi:hypothetical protein
LALGPGHPRRAGLGGADLPRLIPEARGHLMAAADPVAGKVQAESRFLMFDAISRGNADIALALSISLNTAQAHVRNILTKTGCANRTEAAAYGSCPLR